MKKLGQLLENFDQGRVLELIAQIDAAQQSMQAAVASMKLVEEELRTNGLIPLAEKLGALDWNNIDAIKEELRNQIGQ